MLCNAARCAEATQCRPAHGCRPAQPCTAQQPAHLNFRWGGAADHRLLVGLPVLQHCQHLVVGQQAKVLLNTGEGEGRRRRRMGERRQAAPVEPAGAWGPAVAAASGASTSDRDGAAQRPRRRDSEHGRSLTSSYAARAGQRAARLLPQKTRKRWRSARAGRTLPGANWHRQSAAQRLGRPGGRLKPSVASGTVAGIGDRAGGRPFDFRAPTTSGASRAGRPPPSTAAW